MSPNAQGRGNRRRDAVSLSCLAVFAVALTAALLTSRAADWEPLGTFFVLAAFNVASEILGIRDLDRPGLTWTITSGAPLVLAMTLLGPAPALAIGVIGLIPVMVRDRNQWANLPFDLASYGTFLVGGGLLAGWLIDVWSLAPDQLAFAGLVFALYLWVEVTSAVQRAIYGVVGHGASFRDEMRRWQGPLLGFDATAALLTGLTAYVYGTTGLGALALLAVVQLAFQYLLTNLMLSRRRADRLEVVSASRGRLVGQVLGAEEKERRRLAAALHDDALQDLCLARRAVSDDHDPELTQAIDRAIRQLRSEIFDLHPAALDRGDLAAALDDVAGHHAQLAGFRAEVEVDEAACGRHDLLLFVLGREQITNAAKHSDASEVRVAIARDNGTIVMEVSDDGCGMDAERRIAARDHGHIGLASSAERVEAVGGQLEIDSDPGSGTRITTTLPIEG